MIDPKVDADFLVYQLGMVHIRAAALERDLINANNTIAQLTNNIKDLEQSFIREKNGRLEQANKQ